MSEENNFDFMSRRNTTISFGFFMHAPQITNEQKKNGKTKFNSCESGVKFLVSTKFTFPD